MQGGEVSRWHRVDAAEVWHWYAGAAMEVKLSEKKGRVKTLTLGPDLAAGARPQIIVPKMVWQSARSLGDFTLIGCTVAPGFEFEGFELAPKGWRP